MLIRGIELVGDGDRHDEGKDPDQAGHEQKNSHRSVDARPRPASVLRAPLAELEEGIEVAEMQTALDEKVDEVSAQHIYDVHEQK